MPNANVFAFNEKAERIWQIEEPPQSTDYNVSFADISLNENGNVIAGTTIGTEYVVNTIDGSIKPITEGNRPW